MWGSTMREKKPMLGGRGARLGNIVQKRYPAHCVRGEHLFKNTEKRLKNALDSSLRGRVATRSRVIRNCQGKTADSAITTPSKYCWGIPTSL